MKSQGFAKINQKRLFATKLILCLLFVVITIRLFSLQIIRHDYYVVQAKDAQEIKQVLEPTRGSIYVQDKEGNLISVAINKRYYYLYAVPKNIKNTVLAVEKISEILPINKEVILNRLSRADDPFEPIYHRIEDEKIIQQLKELDLEGIHLGKEYHRYYPFGDFASQVIGFVSDGVDGKIQGRYGIESHYNDILAGSAGLFSGVRDAFGRLIRSLLAQEYNVLDGSSLVLTIDRNIQAVSESTLEDLIKGRNAVKGSIVVMESNTGRILSLANYPTFNINNFYQEKDWQVFRNIAVENRYELGSVLKTFTLAAGLDTDKITPETTFVDKGFYEIDGFRITNFNNEVHGETTMRRFLERSINTGAIFIQQLIGGEVLREYFRRFGFGEKTGIDLPNEVVGDLSNLEFPRGRPSHLITASFGYGVPINLMSLLKAHTPFLNQGRLIAPYIVESIMDNKGNKQQQEPLTDAQKIIDPETAQEITSIMVSTIENGFGGNAKINGYTMGGKTGTAFIPRTDGPGYTDKPIHTFVGFFPASKPRFLIGVKLNSPQAGGVAGQTVTLAFREIKRFLINYYNIPPDEIINETR